ncbi:secreted RxLR effector protein 161-like [Bidens hawaiensis]|uniref:secreted RxLR effector protein 161-like n=1 Tax=Bidens hawaiensis TaxID=980011 RepID=UPI0040492063
MEICNPAQIPLDPSIKVSKFEDEEDFDATRYRKIVGCLRYLLQTRPDLAYSVRVVSRYMQSPKQSHATLIKQILRYIQGPLSFGISYTREKNVLLGYSDSSHNIDQDDGRSTTGHCTVALSSCEAEYMAASAAGCQLGLAKRLDK